MSLPLAVTCGDPAGVGPELIARILREGVDENLRLFGPAGWLEALGSDGVAVGDPDFHLTPGAPSDAGARIALGAMEAAAEACPRGECTAVVTGPVSKHVLARIGF